MERFTTRIRRRSPWMTAILLVLVSVTLAGCSTSDDEGEPPTTLPQPSATVPLATATTVPTETVAVATTVELTDENALLVSDGLCQMLVPVGWVDDGTGRGTTSGRHRFVLFGGRLTSSTSWAAAINVVATPTAGREIATTEKSDDSILAIFADDRGFEYRERFDSIYCDLSVTSASKPIAAEERAYWDAIIDSIEPAQ